ncbi:MAG: DUF7002 family protein [Dongiaceae bacterium]
MNGGLCCGGPAVRPAHASPRPIDRPYHLAEAVNWPSIERHGLLSARALLDLVGTRGSERARIERRHRPASVTLADGIVLRDQRPMPPAALERCLTSMTPAQWYALLNAKVFFWLDPGRLNRQRWAGVASPQVVIVIDAARLLAGYAKLAAVTPIDTANARRRPARRGRHSFVPYETWPKSGWASEAAALGTRPRSRSHRPVELTVAGSVPDVMEFALDMRHLQCNEGFMP